MIIYIDILFLINIFLDFILLMSVSITLTRNIPLKKIILGSMIGGVSTILLFININLILLNIFKLLLGIIMVIATFSYKNIKYTFNNLFYFFTIGTSCGGVLYLLKDIMIYNYIILVISFIIVIIIYIRQIKKYNENYSNYYSVLIYYKGNSYKLTGYLDTGNKLYDPYKRRKIILIDKKININSFIYVPYTSIDKEGIIKCFKPDKIIINNKEFKNYLVGISNKKIQIDGVNCLLHSKMKGMI